MTEADAGPLLRDAEVPVLIDFHFRDGAEVARRTGALSRAEVDALVAEVEK